MSIVPAPQFVNARQGELTLGEQVYIACSGKGADGVGRYLAEHLEERYELETDVDSVESPSCSYDGGILLSRVAGPHKLSELSVPGEAYELEVTPDGIVIRALECHGLFNGVQTLIQLLPATSSLDAISVQCMEVRQSCARPSSLLSVSVETSGPKLTCCTFAGS